jgi:hypothetical protein
MFKNTGSDVWAAFKSFQLHPWANSQIFKIHKPLKVRFLKEFNIFLGYVQYLHSAETHFLATVKIEEEKKI